MVVVSSEQCEDGATTALSNCCSNAYIALAAACERPFTKVEVFTISLADTPARG